MKNLALFAMVLAVVLVGGIFLLGSSTEEPTTTITTGEAQQITLSMKNANYYPNTLTVKANQPVELTLDNTVGGCFRSFTVRELGVSKVSRSPTDKITFTPTKAGTYAFSCSMGMGYGKLVVQ